MASSNSGCKLFRSMSIWPTKEDINLTRDLDLKENHVRDPYEDSADYLDIQFRLIREELVKPLRDDVRMIREKRKELGDKFSWEVFDRLKVYQDIIINDLNKFDTDLFAGLVIQVSFNKQPFKEMNWRDSELLKPGNILVLSSDCFDKSFFFCVLKKIDNYKELMDKECPRAKIIIQVKYEDAFDLFKERTNTFTAIESKTYFEGVRHTLSELQSMKDVVLDKYLVDLENEIEAPSYMSEKTCYNLIPTIAPLGEFASNEYYTDFYRRNFAQFAMRNPHKDQLDHLASRVELDKSQFDALFSALTKKFTAIQGPPGCGKTYVGMRIVQALIENQREWTKKERPILIYCYKNHALDQFLEGILKFCKSLIRIGGRCESETLAKYRLEHVRQQLEYKFERESYKSAANRFTTYLRELQLYKDEFEQNLAEKLEALKLENGRKKEKQNKRKIKSENKVEENNIDIKASGGDIDSEEEEEEAHEEFDWEKYRDAFEAKLAQLNSECEEMKDSCDQRDLLAIAGKKVVGMTVTGAAKRRKLLEKLKPKIVIVEEASEMVEAHLTAALPSSVEHLILIGDHKQLRPITVLQGLDLEISLFERMVTNGMPYVQLNVQHRMRPIIAGLIREGDFYFKLTDHNSVGKYKPIPCTNKKNLFFLSHDRPEDRKSFADNVSKSNYYEALYVVELARYFVMKRIKPEDIVILTTYNAQLDLIRSLMKQSKRHIFHQTNKKEVLTDYLHDQIEMVETKDLNVRTCTVDAFQGEESDIVLISFVRSNPEGKIGFISNENRICVALSRAKKGLYCVGNFEAMAKSCVNWRRIINYAKNEEAFGHEIELEKHGIKQNYRHYNWRDFWSIKNPFALEKLNSPHDKKSQEDCDCFPHTSHNANKGKQKQEQTNFCDNNIKSEKRNSDN